MSRVDLNDARRIAATYDPVVPPGARERVWQRVEREQRRPWLQRVTWAQAGLVAAFAAALWIVRAPTEAPVEVAWTPVRPGVALTVDRASVRVMAPSIVRTPPATTQKTTVQMVDGELRFDVQPRPDGQRFVVETRHAIVRVVGTTFTVETDDDGTHVRVEEGVVEVTPRGGAPVRLTAGTNLEVAPARRAIAPVASRSHDEPERAPLVAAQAPPPKRRVKIERPASPAPVAPEKPAPVPVPNESVSREKLRTARRVMDSDAPRAVTLAAEVLDEQPTLEVEALAVLADAQRRAGALGEAARLYGQLADHSKAQAYEEEALLWRAFVLRDLGRLGEGEAALDRAHERHPMGPLAMERAALAARLALADGDPRRAASVLSRAPNRGVSMELVRARIDVAEALVGSDATVALQILAPLESSTLPPALAERVRRIVSTKGP